MIAKVFDGKTLAKNLRQEIKLKLTQFRNQNSHGFSPCLAIIQVGENPTMEQFLKCGAAYCREVGIKTIVYHIPESSTEAVIIENIELLNHDNTITAIVIGKPLPKQLSSGKIFNSITPEKDVDCCTSYNQGAIMTSIQSFNSSCCLAVLKILEEIKVELKGSNVLIIGASLGKLIALNLLNKGASVSICNEFTKDIQYYSKNADIIIAACGVPNLVKGTWLKLNCILIDVGINYNRDGNMVGDIEFESARHIASWITPVPGGVGPVTLTMLLNNIVEAAIRQHYPNLQ